jgi:hypothetical protein
LGESPSLQAPACEKMPSAPPDCLRVGIAWAGNPNHYQDAARSIPLEVLAPILQVPGVVFYSLQHTVPSRDRTCLETLSNSQIAYPTTEPESSSANPSHRSPILPLLGERAGVRVNSSQSTNKTPSNPPAKSFPKITTLTFGDFLETASIIRELDLVIAADTAVAHLAGALGKPVWLLLQHSPDWRWFLDRDDSPWYPNMRLFRQTERNNWTHPIARVAETLQREFRGAIKV